MSRIGKKPVAVPKGVTVELEGSTVAVKGPKGELRRDAPPGDEGGAATTARSPSSAPARTSATRRCTASPARWSPNMVEGVTKGFSKTLEIEGVGYKAEAKPYGLQLDRRVLAPGEVRGAEGDQDLGATTTTVVKIEGADKEIVGQVAAEIRCVRPPEPYKGKGIQYQGEQVRRKAGKTGGK